MHIALSILLFCLLVFLSGFFSGSETALTSLSKTKIRKIVLLKKSLHKIFSKWLQYPQGLLTTILVGNTIVNISLSAFATITALQIFYRFNRQIVELTTWFFVTTCILLLGEILPKIYSRSNPERVAITAIKPLFILNKILIPIIKPIMFLVDTFTRTTSGEPISKMTSLSVEEIRTAIVDSGKRGGIHHETSKMLEGALKLAKIKVKEIMIPKEKVEAVDISTNPQDVLDRIIETGRSRVPVYSGDKNKIVGVVLLKDVKDKFSVDLVRPIYNVSEDKKVSELLHEFQKGTTHCADVVDSKGNLKGFVTLEDILEEIIGEIVDEYELAKQKA
ncbi:MAG: hemolysin family protein [Elusimicrobiota bacterium]|nr:hemolysin family protein [Elusimicrobiota bacterium]